MNPRMTKEHLDDLIEHREHPSVSLYMPTHRLGQYWEEDRIRLKNLLKVAESQLRELKTPASAIRKLLAPASGLLDDSTFWQHQSDGLAIFLSLQTSHVFRMPLQFEELLLVAGRYQVKPLLPYFAFDGRFYLLALSQNEVRLYEGSKHSIEEIVPEEMPKTLAEALRYDDPEAQLQLHIAASQSPTGGAGQAPVYHGHAVGEDDSRENVLRFLRQVDRGITPYLKDRDAPLVLFAVEHIFPIYREANTYAGLLDKGVPGNPEQMSADELHSLAWSVVKPFFKKSLDEAIARYHDLSNTDNVSDSIEDLVRAAYFGRVDTLFVAENVHRWGRFDRETAQVEFCTDSDPNNEDLLDYAAVQTLLKGGTVYTLDSTAVPAGAHAAAIYRF